jgi:hypothetical protein
MRIYLRGLLPCPGPCRGCKRWERLLPIRALLLLLLLLLLLMPLLLLLLLLLVVVVVRARGKVGRRGGV